MAEVCPSAKNSCCDENLTFKFFENMQTFYVNMIQEIKKVKFFIKYLQKIDLVMYSNVEVNKKKYNEQCLNLLPNFFKDFEDMVNTHLDDILKSLMEYYLYKFDYSVDQFCNVCSPEKQRFFKISIVNQNYVITLSKNEIKNYIQF